MKYEVNQIAVGDTVVIKFGYGYTEHEVVNVVDDMLKIKPEHLMLNNWASPTDVVAVVKPDGVRLGGETTVATERRHNDWLYKLLSKWEEM